MYARNKTWSLEPGKISTIAPWRNILVVRLSFIKSVIFINILGIFTYILRAKSIAKCYLRPCVVTSLENISRLKTIQERLQLFVYFVLYINRRIFFISVLGKLF